MLGLQQGNAVLKQIHKEINPESVERLLEETAEAQAYQRVRILHSCSCSLRGSNPPADTKTNANLLFAANRRDAGNSNYSRTRRCRTVRTGSAATRSRDPDRRATKDSRVAISTTNPTRLAATGARGKSPKSTSKTKAPRETSSPCIKVASDRMSDSVLQTVFISNRFHLHRIALVSHRATLSERLWKSVKPLSHRVATVTNRPQRPIEIPSREPTGSPKTKPCHKQPPLPCLPIPSPTGQ